ncbi:alphaN-acetylglucosamine transferase [Fusarium tricinctum]|uniref:AlphaN-acetylglucosamine transferase n=1 Tax=Fusarium tricinctum TaxID=61284 RepID=A0A8K0RTP4_9HYPO|nr:alphaN-acetylglucosamine transferase [Fusarium tricinctum]
MRLFRSAVKALSLFSLLVLFSYRYIYPSIRLRIHNVPSPNAYVFYAAQDVYACSVAVNVHLLRTFFHTKHRIVVFLSPDISQQYFNLFKDLDVTVIEEEPVPLNQESISYYYGCLLKLAAFRMHEIDPSVRRILTLDADQIILKNLDHLFDLPSTPFLAPTAYWISQDCLSSTLMLIEPNPALWSMVQDALMNPKPNQYDMDIINVLFGYLSDRIPGKYVTLNSHWEDRNLPAWFNSSDAETRGRFDGILTSDQDLASLYHEAYVLHFTAVGKPWMYSTDQVREARLDAHPVLFEQWETWRSLAADTCPDEVVVQL